MKLLAILALGFFLGMRHATDADHVMAVSTIVSRKRSLRAAAPIGVLWGIGHTLTILITGGAIIMFGVVIPPHLGLGMELSAALMLVLLGGLNVRSVLRDATTVARMHGAPRSHSHEHEPASAFGPATQRENTRALEQCEDGNERRGRSMRPLVVGVVHGLAGSAAVALLVLGAIRDPLWALGYLIIFGAGTIAGMLLVTIALAVPITAAARRFDRLHHVLGVATGFASLVLGTLLAYRIGFVHGLFTGHPRWTPE